MEKLIELLNKHRRETVKKQSGITEWRYNAFTFSLDNISGQQAELLIISKQYGFIKRLVENDKIDREKVKEKSDRIPLLLDKVGDIYNCGVLKSVLMLLSISDTPIDDLISYLK